jgi:hypothetical protein
VIEVYERWARLQKPTILIEDAGSGASLIQELGIRSRLAGRQHNTISQTSILNRIRGERADNLEQAIALFEAALTVRTREAFPASRAMTLQNLAIAYSERTRGERADNLERAIAHCEAALTVCTREAFPIRWAATQHNLANTYLNRIRGERADKS